MKALVIRLLLLIPMTGMILGCASTTSSEFPPPIPRQEWVPQQEVYNLEKVITEKGPASWVQELDNGYTEAAWITRKSRSRVFLKVMTFDREKRFISSRKKVASPMRMGRGYSKTKSSTPKSSGASRVTPIQPLIRAENAGQPLKKPEVQLGKVMLVDKNLGFVVVDFGRNVKPVAGLKYLVYRGDKQIGEVTTTNQTDGFFIVANINKGDIRMGDSLQLSKLQPKP